MCGRMNVTDEEGIQDFLDSLGVEYPITPQLNIAPGGQTEFIIDAGEDRDLVKGYWSFMIEPKPEGKTGFRPNGKFKTFNAKSSRLEESRLWSGAIRTHRCIVPVSGFHEWKDRQCYNITPAEGSVFALGGMYRFHQFGETIVPSFTVITLPQQEKFKHIHHTFPFMLKSEDIDAWLDPAQQDLADFYRWMNEGIRQPIRVASVGSPSELAELDHQIIG